MKRYTDAMNEVGFTSEEKQELSARLRQAAQSAPQHTRKPKRHRVRRAVCGALAAALAVTTLTAAAVPAFGDTLRTFFGMPVQSYPVGKSVTQLFCQLVDLLSRTFRYGSPLGPPSVSMAKVSALSAPAYIL